MSTSAATTVWRPCCIALAVWAAWPAYASAQETRSLDRVTVVGGRPATLPLEIPTTTEGLSAAEIARTVNATDAEDVLKYFPSLNVRKRYLGDFDHAVLATRASGTGNSARSLVYADGILLSNLLGNGASYTPRWGLVTPEEIDRVDVLYGPFSAAFPGNSVGAVVDYVTRMPRALEAHVKLQGSSQRFEQYSTRERYGAHSASASLGSRDGGFSWWVHLKRLDSEGQPLVFPNRLRSQGAAGGAGTPVTGAVADRDPRNRDGWILGATSQVHTVQDHLKLKLAYDLSPSLRASYTLGVWQNESEREAQSYLRDTAGNVVTTGVVNIDGRDYTLTPGDFAGGQGRQEHLAHGVSVKSQTRSRWDWEFAASRYDYRRDQQRSSTGTLTDMAGTGWNTLALKGIWRPEGTMHTVEGGLQQEAFQLRSGGSARFCGDTTLQSLWAQDAWHLSPEWRLVAGLRVEHWHAFDGNVNGVALGERRETWVSPKAAVAWHVDDDWTLKASLGRAVRAPTVAELYQGRAMGDTVIDNDPNLRPEKSWTAEWSAQRLLRGGQLRTTVFAERTADALYSQTGPSGSSTIQNVEGIRTWGLEVAGQSHDVPVRGLDLSGSLTFSDSIITKNDGFPATVGRWQPRVPRWRANLVATWREGDRWSSSFGLRYSGRQYGTLDNSDPNGNTYTGVSEFLVADVRFVYRFDRQWSASVGVDNLNNERYWAFHPYTQRTFNAELKFDL